MSENFRPNMILLYLLITNLQNFFDTRSKSAVNLFHQLFTFEEEKKQQVYQEDSSTIALHSDVIPVARFFQYSMYFPCLHHQPEMQIAI